MAQRKSLGGAFAAARRQTPLRWPAGWSLYWQRGVVPVFSGCPATRVPSLAGSGPRGCLPSSLTHQCRGSRPFPDHDRPHVPREAPIQEAAVVWLKGKGIMYVASANGRFHGHRSVGAQYRKMGVEPGVADLLVLEVGYDGKPGLAIELKCEGNRLQASQEAWLQRVRSKGWRTAVVYGNSPDDGLAKVKECVLFHIDGPAGTSEERPIICE